MIGLRRYSITIELFSIHYTILLSHKKNGILLFAATWVDLEIIILSESRSGRERQIYDVIYMWNQKNNTKSSCRDAAETNPTRNREVAGSIRGLA